MTDPQRKDTEPRRDDHAGVVAEEPRDWLIRKGGYYYRPNCQGYTTRVYEAGRYTKAEADRECAVEPWHMSAERAPNAGRAFDVLTKRTISHEEARACLKRFIDGHFRNAGDHPRIGIPARPDYDDDLVLSAYIRQQEAIPTPPAEPAGSVAGEERPPPLGAARLARAGDQVWLKRDVAEQIEQKLRVIAAAFPGDKQTRDTLLPAVTAALAALAAPAPQAAVPDAAGWHDRQATTLAGRAQELDETGRSREADGLHDKVDWHREAAAQLRQLGAPQAEDGWQAVREHVAWRAEQWIAAHWGKGAAPGVVEAIRTCPAPPAALAPPEDSSDAG